MICKVEFENPENQPLNELQFYIKENGVQLKVPALSSHWVQPRCYTKYRGLPLENGEISSQAVIDEWLSETDWFNKDLEYLLSLEHFRFWSHLVYEPKCIVSVISFLQEATPHYVPIASVTADDRVISLYMKILNNILKIICRMITNKESETEWIRKDNLKELLYSKFLISIPMIFDLIVAYGRSNMEILTKIIQTIFKIEPKYGADLKVGLQYLQNAFKIVQRKIENEGQEIDGEPASSFDDLALYSLDCASTLCIFLEAYPEARTIGVELQLDQKIATFYDNAIPMLYKNLFAIDETSKSLEFVNFARLELLKSFRYIVYTHVETILEKPSESLLPAEHFIAVLTECLSERTFVIDYQKYFPIANDIDVLKQACKELDLFKADFILRAYTSEGESYSCVMDLIGKDDFEDEPLEEIQNNVPDETIPEAEDLTPSRDIVDEVKQVLDLLPHLGDGFIRRLLPRYDNPEAVVAAILEGNLPPDLIDADQSEAYIPPDLQDKVFLETGIRRLNIYDGDKYDVMTQDMPNCIIKTGKGFPGQPKNAKQMLDDKSYVREMRSRYQEYSLVSEDNEYDDEYDDSYDAMADSEAKPKGMKSAKNIIVDEVDDDESEEEDEKIDKETGRDKSRDFCENPDDVRARYEAKRNMFMQKRPGKASAKTADVVGSPKGQGQDKNVTTSRHKKDVNKSSRANHNRKSGASWKRTRGMIPS